MLTQWIFAGIVAVVIVQRLFELYLSQRNAKYILTQGGEKHSDNWLGAVKILQVAWFAGMIAEVWWLDRPFIPLLAGIALTATIAAQVLRYYSMQALSWRWTLLLMTVPKLSVVDTGVYRYLRHPNWLGVILEITALPLIHGAYLTAIIASLVNGLIMSQRVALEEEVLEAQTNYGAIFADRPRFLPVR